MPGSTRLSPEWRDWIIENLAGGCDPQALAEEMARKGFDRAFAAASVQRCGARGFAVEDGAAAGAYVYEATSACGLTSCPPFAKSTAATPKLALTVTVFPPFA